MIMIPEWRYYKMIESYDKAIKELEKLKKALEEAGTSTKAISNPTTRQGKPDFLYYKGYMAVFQERIKGL